MTAGDAFDRLRRANPTPTPLGPTPSEVARADAILASVLDGDPQRHRRRGRRILIPVAIAAAVATAAATWIVSRSPDDPTQIACFESADLDADIVGIGATGEDPVAACERVWTEGEFADTDVSPELFACVLDSGVVGVFPSTEGEPCSSLGLDRAVISGEQDPIVAVQDRLATRFGSSCVPLADAEEIVRAEPNEAGMDDWSVESPPATPPERPCASVAIDVARRTVSIVPIPDP